MSVAGLISVLCGSLLVLSASRGADAEEAWPVLEGPYLGQSPPGMTPEIFAAGVISSEDEYELNSVFSLDGNEFYYAISTTSAEEKEQGQYFYLVMVTRRVGGIWTKPKRAPFSDEHMTVDIALSPDGTRLYFCSDRPTPWGSPSKLNIWSVERRDGGWSEPVSLGRPLNSPEGETQPSFLSDGTVYFPSDRQGSAGVDLYFAKHVGGGFAEPVNLGPPVNTEYNEGNSFVAPDESYILFARWGMPASLDGGKGLYISFRKEDGTWTQPRNTEPRTGMNGSLANLSPDGKYLFYSQGGDIFWVDAKIIDTLKLTE